MGMGDKRGNLENGHGGHSQARFAFMGPFTPPPLARTVPRPPPDIRVIARDIHVIPKSTNFRAFAKIVAFARTRTVPTRVAMTGMSCVQRVHWHGP